MICENDDYDEDDTGMTMCMTCVSPKAGVVHGRVPVLVHEVHVGLVAEEQLYNLGDRHYNVTFVIIIIIIILLSPPLSLSLST